MKKVYSAFTARTKWLMVFLIAFVTGIGMTYAQPITTTFTNNNGNSLITFNFQNTNAYDIIITDVSSITGISGANTASLYYKTSAIAGLPGAISAANGWNLVASQAFTGVANTATSTAQLMMSGLSLNIPAGATYGLAFQCTSLRYSTLTAGTYTLSSGGCNLITGTNVGYGGTMAPNAPTFTPRGFIGSINFSTGTPCVGTPAPGNTLSTANPVCSGVNFTLSNQFPTPGTGVTYQWQRSTDGGFTYTNIVGATAATYTTTQTAATYYRCNVTCAGSTGTSNPLNVTMNPATSCYCASGATIAADEEIYSVTVNGASTPAAYSGVAGCSTVAPGPGSILGRYSNFTTLGAFTTLNQGESASFSIVENECDGATYYSFGTSIWIDYNQNGLYTDPGEQVFVEGSTLVGPRTISGSFVVPGTATLGTTGMRITVAEGYAGASLTPCLSYGYGETEDFLVTISAGTPCTGTPTPGTIASTATACSGATTTLSVSGYTTGATGIAFQWQESPDGVAGWTNVTTGTGGTTTTYTSAALAADIYYRCVVSCTYTGLSDNTNVCAVDVISSPLGDTFANPIVIGSLPYSTTGNNQSINCWQNNFVGQASPDVYYQVVPVCNGTMNISMCGGGTLTDTYLHLLNAAGTILVSNDDNGPSCAGLLSSINYSVTAGTTYYIVVEGYSLGQGTYSLSVSNTALFATWFADADGDSYGDPAATTTTCDGIAPAGYVGNNLDCNDANAAINPTATEICNGFDDDCDALVDDADPDVVGLSVFFADADGDGYGNGAVLVYACAIGPGYSVDPSDCDDTQSTVYPDAPEICDGLDNNCNGETDEGVVTATVTPAAGASVCKPDYFTFSAPTGAGYTYQWFKNGVAITGATSDTYATNKPAYYQVQVNVPGGCFALSTESFLTVLPAPNANIFTPNGTSLCTTVKLKASYDASYTWQWFKDDGAIAGATGYLYFPTLPGNYYCVITTADGCSRTTATVAVTACREDEPSAAPVSELFEIFPNPSAGDFTINMELNTTEQNALVTVLNLVGDQIYSGSLAIANGTINSTISLNEGTAAGMYLVRVVVADREYTKQIVLQK